MIVTDVAAPFLAPLKTVFLRGDFHRDAGRAVPSVAIRRARPVQARETTSRSRCWSSSVVLFYIGDRAFAYFIVFKRDVRVLRRVSRQPAST